MNSPMDSIADVTDADLQRLDSFLSSDCVPDTAMDISTLEGFLTAVVIGPEVVLPSQWLSWVWDVENGRDEVAFESREQAQEVIGLIMALLNRIATIFDSDPNAFEPVFHRSATWGAAEWCEGFLLATQRFNAQAWTALWARDSARNLIQPDHIGLVTPFLRLADEPGFEITGKAGDAERWVEAIAPALVSIHQYWLQRRSARRTSAPPTAPLRREAPKVGRKDPCPCGSGVKFKKCCGQAKTLH
jgi:uncharacterized protein